MKRRSSVGAVLLGFVVIVLLLALIVGGYAMSSYNHVVALDETVKKSWAQVENVLQRRYDLIPNLVETVRGYATHERELFENIAQARTRYFQPGSVDQKAERANQLEGLLSRLLVLQEQYPQLKAQEGFLRLQDQLEGTENRVAVERQRYNESVGTLNTYRRGLLGRTVAGWAGVAEAKYFEAPEKAKEAPKVDFGGGEKTP